ncbi:MAG: helix-turn-helix domain-containing protein [Terasakiella sp.]|uniref:helix-turn-helix domain-containing protein n=1 Tax=unclassified Terasakiella TaxID=2614952 RepID=UPI003B006CC3
MSDIVNKKRADDVDRFVGEKIRERRIMLGLTQQELAKGIGVTYQQAHKYEQGVNRVSAGRLFEIARMLNTPVEFFFDGVGGEIQREANPRERMGLELSRHFSLIRNEKHQEALSSLARALADERR